MTDARPAAAAPKHRIIDQADVLGMVNPVLDYRVTAYGDGLVRVVWTPPARLANPAGMVHGGYISMLVDDCCGLSINSLLPHMTAIPTVTLKVDFLRGIRVEGTYEAVGSVTRIGRQVSFASCDIRDPNTNALLAHGEGVFTGDLSDSGVVGFSTK